jgi:hypothetical protein
MPDHRPPHRSRRRPQRRDPDDAAAGNVISYLVGIGVFLSVFAISLSYIGIFSQPATSRGDIDLDSKARNLVTVLTGSPGVPADWETQPSNLNRLGLLEPGTEITLSEAKIAELQPSGAVGYSDARDALGLDNHEFNLRTQPKFEGDDNRTAIDGYRLAYMGDFDGGETGTSQLESGTFSRTSASYNNTTASGDEVLEDPGDKFKDDRDFIDSHLIPRLAGIYHVEDEGSLVTSSTWWNMTDTDNHSTTLRPDKRNILAVGEFSGGTWDYADTENDRVYVAKLDLSDYDGSDVVRFNLSHHADGDGGATDLDPDEGLVQTRPVDDKTATWTDENGGFTSEGSDVNDFVNSSVTLSNGKGDHVWVALRWSTDADSLTGTGWFVSDWTIEAQKDGKWRTLATNDLDYNTTRYDVLAVGQGVEDGELSMDDVKSDIHQWIKAGGDVIGLPPHQTGGGGASSTNWLEPWIGSTGTEDNPPLTFHEAGSNTTHAHLTALHDLDYDDWPWTSEIWGVSPSDPFTWVITVEDGSGQVEPGLAVTTPDAPGDGSVLLTSVDATQLNSQERRNNFENNLVWSRYSGLFLEFGDGPGEGHTTGSAKSVTLVDATEGNLDHPNYEVFVNTWR